MVEPPVVSPSTGTAAAKALSYVALRSHDGKRVILPVAAAAGSHVLHGLFQGLCVMQLHQSVAAPAAAATVSAQETQKTPIESIPVIEDDDDTEEDGAAYCSYATAFPWNAVCQPPASLPSLATSSSSCSAPAGGAAAASLLEVPIRSLEMTTLARVAEFLVVKCTLASHPHYLHEADVFGDLDRTSERDQLTAMQVLLGADFLNC